MFICIDTAYLLSDVFKQVDAELGICLEKMQIVYGEAEQHERDYQAQVSWFLVFYNVMWKGKSEYIRKSKTCNMFESKTLTFHLGNAKCESKQIT